jgi:hypothetical protein
MIKISPAASSNPADIRQKIAPEALDCGNAAPISAAC